MASWALIQGDGGNSPSLAFPSNVQAGTLLIVGCAGDDANTPSAPTDTRGNTYTQIHTLDNAGNEVRTAWWYAISNGAGANTVSFTNMQNFDAYVVAEFSVDAGSIVIDDSSGTPVETGQVGNTTSDANAFTSGSVTTQGPDRLIVGFGIMDGPDTTLTAGTNFTEATDCATNLDGFTGNPVKLEYRTLSTAGSVEATWTGGGGTVSGHRYVAAFKTSALPEVAFDAATESPRTATTDPYTFSHTGRAEASGGVQGVVVVIIHGTSATDHVVGVTYGGVGLRRLRTAQDTTTEQGRTDIWFLGERLRGLGGSQTVSVDLSSPTTDDIEITAITLTTNDGSEIEVLDSGIVENNVADPSVSLAYNGRFGIAIAGLYGGGAAPSSFTPNANCVEVASEDLGNFYAFVLRQTTPGIAAATFAIGGTAVSDDVAYAAAAFGRRQFRRATGVFQDPAVL